MKDDDNCGFGEERNAFGLACEKFYSNFEGSIGICGSISKNREDKLEKEEAYRWKVFLSPFPFFPFDSSSSLRLGDQPPNSSEE